MIECRVFWICLAICCLVVHISFSQQGDSIEIVESDTTDNIIDKVKDTKLSKEVLKSVRRKQEPENFINIKSEAAFLPFEGKYIRQILINHVGFERSLTDSSRNVKNALVKIGNALHSNSKEWMIRDHVFFREKKPLNPYLLADNERYLRDLNFIVDARIYVMPLTSTDDSVDVLVVTRDVFSIGGSFSPRGVQRNKI